MPIDKDSSGNYKHLAIKDYPPFEPSNKANNNRLGPMAWVQEHQPDVFKFVMSGSTCTINPRVQQEILNKYYGVDLKGKLDYTSSDSEQVAECRKKRPIIKAAGSHPGDLSDPIDGTHCSYDMRRKTPSPIEDCY